MLTETQVSQIKEHLSKAQNPIFFFDNDPDGLCSFLILQRYVERGKGIPVRPYPGLTADFFKRVKELNADYIFILDKPLVDREFFDEADRNNIPVVWIDHHEINTSNIPDFVSYYNPLHNHPKGNEPVTFLCYQVSKKREDLWLDIAGCISDGFVPEEYKDFKKRYPEFSFDSENAFDILYKSEVGKIARILGFCLKDRTTNVINMIKLLIKIKEPIEILEENPKNHLLHRRFEHIEKRLKKLFEKSVVMGQKSKKMLFFQYSGDLSISSDLANQLIYKFPNKIIVVVYVSGAKANISARGERVKEYILKAIENLDGSRGGGHENAVGAQIRVEDLKSFREKLEEIIK